MEIFGYFLIIILNSITLILIIRVILSWLVLPPSIWIYWLNKITDPIFNFFRKKTPIRIGFIDLSIIVPFLLINIFNKIIMDLLINRRIPTPFYFILLIFFIIESIISIIFTILFVFTIVIFFVNIFAPYSYNPFITAMRSVIDPIAIYLTKIIKIKSKNADRIYLIIIAIFIIIFAMVIFVILNILKLFLSKIIP